MPIPVHTIMLTNGFVATVSSIILNLILGWLVIKHTPLQMKGYSRLMLVHCVADVLFDVVNFTLGPVVVPLRQYSFMILQGLVMGVDGPTTDKLFTLSTWIGLTAILLIPIDFIYRYMSVCRNRELSTRTIAIMVFAAYAVVWFYAFPVKWFTQSSRTGPAPGMENYTAMLQNVSEWSDNVPSYVLSTANSEKPTWISSVYVVGMNVFTLAVIIYTSIRIHWTIGHKVGLSNNKKAMEVHRQVTKILIIQAALPIAVIIGPIMAIILCGILRLQVPLIGFYAALCTIWFSAMKPFATILIIEKYKRQVFGRMCGGKVIQRGETTSWASSSRKTEPKTAGT